MFAETAIVSVITVRLEIPPVVVARSEPREQVIMLALARSHASSSNRSRKEQRTGQTAAEINSRQHLETSLIVNYAHVIRRTL